MRPITDTDKYQKRLLPPFLILIAFLMGVGILVALYIVNQSGAGSSDPGSGGGRAITDEEFDQILRHLKARTLRDTKIQHGLPLNDPNNFPLPSWIASLHDAAKNHIFLLAKLKRQHDLGLPLDDPNLYPEGTPVIFDLDEMKRRFDWDDKGPHK